MAVGMLTSFLCVLVAGFAVMELVLAQDQSDFISIDCGMPDSSTIIDKKTGIKYVSDAKYINSGINKNISDDFLSSTLDQQFWNVRSFPEGIRNCYTLKPKQGKNITYLVRASFMYGNYDDQNLVPEFDLYLGVNIWDSVKLENNTAILVKEINHVPSLDTISVCLVNTGLGNPFISALELRILKYSTYKFRSKTIALRRRWNLGPITNQSVRFEEDIYDRIWMPLNFSTCRVITTSLPIIYGLYQPPPVVLSTAVTPINVSEALSLYFEPENPADRYYIYMHFNEVEELEANQLREFNITMNGELWYENMVPRYLKADTLRPHVVAKGESIEVLLTRTNRSTLPPIINALEIFKVKETPQVETNQNDVDAVMNIKSTYGVKKNWQGDPCAPKAYSWEGLNCSYNNQNPRIISLNLSSSRLSGEITPHLANLSLIQILDLSNNSLTGEVPEFLAQLSSLKILNLSGNKLSGSVPDKLIERSNEGLLSLSMDNYPVTCSLNECQPKKKKKNGYVIPVIAAVAILVLLFSGIIAIWILRRKPRVAKTGGEFVNKDETRELDQQRYTHTQIVEMTNNFETVLGRGGFGIVYLGYLDETKVAVKMLHPSVQGTEQFHTEVKLLMRVHHRNLTGLVGYCNEGPKKGLICEFMANGDLEACLSGSRGHILSWEERLRIAMDAAQGLEYLHSDCNPPIIHRDIKSTNILLNDKFQAKLADFGLSRIFPIGNGASGRHVTTVVAGTPGYLDPEYYSTNWLNEKSDVYSFGIVLMEIITSRPVITNTTENFHIGQWVKFMHANGDIEDIVDPRLKGNYGISSAERALEVALACIAPTSERRPSMNYVVSQLKECLAREMARTNDGQDIDINHFF